jgi:hypothetical protein
MKKLTALVLAAAAVFLSGCGGRRQTAFKNEYTLPEALAPYTRIDTAPKTDWAAEYIWDGTDGAEENVWMCFRKTATLDEVPDALPAYISADSKYWLYINGALAVFEGGVKRGPAPDGSYYDTVEIAPFLKPGKNVICALVWYWGKDKSFSYADSGRAGFLFEAGEIRSDRSWKVCRHAAFGTGGGLKKPNYRLAEVNIVYDARKAPGDWLSPDFDDAGWANAAEGGNGGAGAWGTLYPRGIPMLKDCGLRDYLNSADYENRSFASAKRITLRLPYNAQFTPYLKIDAPAGKTVRITTENTAIGAVSSAYITKAGVQEFESPGWVNGMRVTYRIPAGVTVLALKYRETGYDTAFAGNFACENGDLNTLWQKSLRTLYVTMRDNFMDCPDRERAQWWGDVTSEMMMSAYALDPAAYLLYQKGVACMLGHTDPETKILQTVVPISGEFFELPVQQLAGICGFWAYYLYTGDRAFLQTVYGPALDYVNLWRIGENGLVQHREGSWDWMDWGQFADAPAMENAWYYYALSCLKNMAEALGKDAGTIPEKMERLRAGYASFWSKRGYKSGKALFPDDRANALAVLSGLATPEQYGAIASVLKKTKHASPYMEYYVLEALCKMGEFAAAKERMLRRYGGMIRSSDSTLWEFWVRLFGTRNHAWSGGPLVIMSKYFAGIAPTSPGWENFEVRPQPDVCETIDCTVPTGKGYIRLRQKKTAEGFALETDLPAKTGAVIHIPCAAGDTVKCGDAVIWENGVFTPAEGLSLVSAGNGALAVEIRADVGITLRFNIIRNA